jgi:ribosomal protein S18 acetylase RimI-like enzyme
VAAGQVVIASWEGDDIGWGSSVEARITGLYVRSSGSGRGAGRLIMARLETEIVKRGYGYARLESSPNAAGFYSSLGYVHVGPPDDDGAVPMEKCLNETGASK